MSKHKDDSEDKAEVVGYVAGGLAAGAGVAGVVGNMGLVAAGGGIAITAAPVVAAGAVVGLAVYGLKKAFFN
ncbi:MULTISPECIES: hypothetical protein [unclassified Microcoleus]|uniref:hypothetical protein n=1 Tax=unclassified Microcoleus TaxID=2642155 RepID=UPI002FD4D5E0